MNPPSTNGNPSSESQDVSKPTNPATHYDLMGLGKRHQWPIKKLLKDEDVNVFYNYLRLPRRVTKEHIIDNLPRDKYWMFDARKEVEIDVVDATNTNEMKSYKMILKEVKSSYRLQNWGSVVMDRRLVEGGEIGMHYSDKMLHFSVFSDDKNKRRVSRDKRKEKLHT